MKFTQLRSFHYVARFGGFSKAAAELGLTQPAISDSVGRLEQQYDVQLFKRDKHQVSLTKAGSDLYVITSDLFRVEQRVLELLSRTLEAGKSTLRIIADTPLHVTPVLARFQDKHPSVNVVLSSGNTSEAIAALNNYNAEIGIVARRARGREFLTQPLGKLEIVAFCVAGGLLSGRTSISFSELAKLPLVFREAGSRTREKVERAAAKQGISLSPAIVSEGREGVRELVAGGVGIGFIAKEELVWDSRMQSVPIEGSPIVINESLLCMLQRKDVPVIKAFIETAREVMDTRAPYSELKHSK